MGSSLDVDRIVEAAARAVEGGPGYAWATTTLAAFLRSGGELATLPETVAREHGDAPRDTACWIALASRTAKAIARRELSDQQAIEISVPEAVDILDIALKQQDALRVEAAAAIEEAGMSKVTWEWLTPGRHSVSAYIKIGRLGFCVDFFGDFFGGPGGDWRQGWQPDPESWKLLSIHNRPAGLFPKVDAALHEILGDFIARVAPAKITIIGFDQKRNDHLAAAYHVLPEGYELSVIKWQDSTEPRGIEIKALSPSPRYVPN